MKFPCLFVCLILSGCARTQRSDPPSEPMVSPGSLVNLASVPWDFTWRQSIEAQYARPTAPGRWETSVFEAILQKQGSVLTMVGLTSFGMRAFAAHQDGVKITVDQAPSMAMPFPPPFIFLDVNRCYFVGLVPFVPQIDGWHHHVSHGEAIRDQWKGGRLIQRVLRNVTDPKDVVSIRYIPGLVAKQAPEMVELSSERYGYRLLIKTLEAETQ